MKKKIVIGIIVLAVVGLIGFKMFGNKNKQTGTMVETTTLEKGTVESRIKSTGTIVSMDKREVMSDVEEKIEKMYVKKGDKVSKGQILMTLDESSIRNKIKESKIRLQLEEESLKKTSKNGNLDLKISLDNLKIKYEDSKREYERNNELYEAGALTKVEVDRSKDTMDQTYNEIILAEDKIRNSDVENDVNMQRQRVELARIELQNLEKDLVKYTIKSPIAGTIVDTKISESGIVEARRMLMSIQDVDNLEMIINMNEYDIGKIKVGNKVTITGDSLQGKKYTGEVKHIANVAKASLSDENQKLTGSDNTIEVKISINKDSDSLKPGLSAKADILTDSKKDVYVLPYETIFTKKDGSKAIFIVENKISKEIPITTGIGDEFNVEVKGDLKDGMEVILNPTEDTVEGTEVTSSKEL